jgi:hypothetical protein
MAGHARLHVIEDEQVESTRTRPAFIQNAESESRTLLIR